MKKEFALFAMEKEGLLSTRESRINRAVKELIAHPLRELSYVQEKVIKDCGLMDATQEELSRIWQEVSNGS